MADGDQLATSLAGAIADCEDIDWRAVSGAASGVEAVELVEQLRIIDDQAQRCRTKARHQPWLAMVRGLYACLLATAGAKVALALVGVVTVTWTPRSSVSAPVFIITLVLFGGAGLVLVALGADRSARRLGALFLLIATAFADPLMPVALGEIGARASAICQGLPTDAFLALGLWQLVWAFPVPPRDGLPRKIGRAFLGLSALVGSVLFVANVTLASGALAAHPSLAAWFGLIDRHRTSLAYWPLVFTTAVGAVPYLIWRARQQPPQARQRVAVFVLTLVCGLTPFLLAVMVTPLVPALTGPPYRNLVGVVLFSLLLSIVPMTAYAVIVRRVIDVRLMIQRTTRHSAARTAVWVLSATPLVLLISELYIHRELTLAAFFARSRSLELALFASAGVSVMICRDRLRLAIDRWFLVEPVDVTEALVRIDARCRSPRSTRELTIRLRQELGRAFHTERVAVLLLDHAAGSFVSPAGDAQPLAAGSRLERLLRSARAVLAADQSSDAVLSMEDRRWLSEGGWQLVAPLITSTDQLVGLVALGASRSRLPWSRPDRTCLGTVSRHFAMRLESHLVRAGSGSDPARHDGSAIDWEREPAAVCASCGRMYSTRITSCHCGGVTGPATVPFELAGKFRLERLIARGGMSVVYLAIDTTLDRRVAVKTLSIHTSTDAARLQREARAMAAVLHPNLALVYAVETWRDTPILIAEYLAGGTLADRLKAGPMAMRSAVHLGVFMADALDRVHVSGLLHRDIKPSNIGFTSEGTPKLLDFGLVVVLDLAEAEPTPDSVPSVSAGRASSVTTLLATHVRGTPLYLSPEAAAGMLPQPSFDLWGLSLSLFEAVVGRHPLAGLTIPEVLERLRRPAPPPLDALPADCPAGLRRLFECALSPVASHRPNTATELRNRLQRVRSELG